MSVFIQAIGSAVPDYCHTQAQLADFMTQLLALEAPEARKLKALYRSTKIHQRYSVLPDYTALAAERTFFPPSPDLEPFPSISERMSLYQREALPLASKAIRQCFSRLESFDSQSITHLITVSCTGLYAPGLDIELIETLGLRRSTQRTAINFMGCYGAFNGLKIAQAICQADPTAVVLLVCVELCTIHFQKKNEEDHLLANSLFADGAGAVVISSRVSQGISLKMKQFYCDLIPEGATDMAWKVADFGFEMVLSSYIPKLVKGGIATLVERLLAAAALSPADVHHYAIHPGGRAILGAIEQALGISPSDNRFAYNVLQEYGNMSSATVLFVLEKLWQSLDQTHQQQNILSCAFGPGLTLESMVLEVNT